jgi:hypothetical protein
MKEAKYRRLCIVLLHLHDISGKAKSMQIENKLMIARNPGNGK